MKTRVLFAVAVLTLAALGASAQPGSIDFTPVACVVAGEMPALQMATADKGELRAYFRRINTTDWCSVVGVNLGKLSSVTMPKFEIGDEIEYFFVVVDNKQVVAKSPQIYRFKVTERCDTPIARHTIMIIMDCAQTGPGAIPSSMGAGYSLKRSTSEGTPPFGSPDRPVTGVPGVGVAKP